MNVHQFNFVIKNMSDHCVIIINYGDLSTKQIVSVLEKMRVKYKILSHDEIPNVEYTHIILSGGPKHVYNPDHYPLAKWIIKSNKPVLGICYGMQLIAKTFGGIVVRMKEKEEGPIEITEMFGGKQLVEYRWMNRYDTVISLSSQFIITAVTNNNHIAGFTDGKKWWAVQYHPEAKCCKHLALFQKFIFQEIPA